MILSKKISKKITDTLVTNEIIEPQKEGIYFYCLDFSLDLILFNCSLLLIGGLLGLFLPSLVYIIILVPVRMLAGGAHAKSPYSCFLLSYSIYFLTLFLSRLPYLIMPGLYILLISLLTLIIWGAGSSWKCTQALHHCRKNKNQKNIVLSVILYLRICSPHAIMETATLLSYDIDLLVHRSYQSMYRTLLES